MARASQIRKLPAGAPLELDPKQDPFAHDSIRHLVARYGSPLFIIDAERVRAQYNRLRGGVARRRSVLRGQIAAARLRRRHVECGGRAASIWRPTAKSSSCAVLGVPPARCIHTHPIKRDGDIRPHCPSASPDSSSTIRTKLRKFVKFRHRASLLIRVSFRSADAVADLSRKFGCEPERRRGPAGARRAAAHHGRGAVVSRRFAGGRARNARGGHQRVSRLDAPRN